MTALLVAIACLVLNYFISTSAIFRMDQIENSVVAVLPANLFTEDTSENGTFHITVSGDITQQIQNAQVEFRMESFLVTLLIALASSAITYFIVGFALRPLQQLGIQVKGIHAKSISQRIEVKNAPREILQLSKAFNEMLQRLEEAFFAQHQFSASAAHELRTPLAIIQTKLEVFQKQKNPTHEDFTETMEMVKTQAERLSHVIDVLLEMTNLQSAEKNDNISLAELVEEVFCDLTQLSNEKSISLHQEPGDARLLGCDALIYRAVYNLVENAIKYNHPGGDVSVSIKGDQLFAYVIIADTGPGISPDNCEKIFEPFFRVDKSREMMRTENCPIRLVTA